MAVQVREDFIFDVPGRPFAIHLPFKLSDDELLELSALNPEVRLEVSAQEDLIVMPPAGGETGDRNAEITMQLRQWAKQNGAGKSFDSSTGFYLPNGALRSPDASWVSHEKLERLSPEQFKKYLPLCPEFIVELLSPSDSLAVTKQKMQEYVVNGAKVGWLIDAGKKRVYVYTSEGTEELDHPESLSAEPVLNGFTLDLSEIWS